MDSTFNSSLLPRDQDGTENSNTLITPLGALEPAPFYGFQRAFQKAPHEHNKRHLCDSHPLGKANGFRSSVPEMGGRGTQSPNIYFLS